MVQIVTFVLLLVFVLQQFSTTNLNAVFKKKQYDNYPYLKDGVESEKYVIQSISDEYPPSVTYNHEHNYFIIEATGYYQKLDADGIEVFKVVRTDDMELPAFASFIFSQAGVIDLSAGELNKNPYKDIINSDRSMSLEMWNASLKEMYDRAEVVIFGNELPYKLKRGFKIYFKVDGGWFLLYTPGNTIRANSNLRGLEHVLPGYPAKFSPAVPLKDAEKKTFSNRQKEEYLLSDGDVEQYRQSYSKIGKIKLLHYKKEMVDDHIAYTRIPISFSGIGYYKLKINNEELYFKESSIKPSFRKVRNHFHWFVLPEKYANKSMVSFMEVSYPHNINNSGSNGLYIIREKQEKTKSKP